MSRSNQTGCLLGGHRRKRARWWWARARWQVLRCHDGLVEGDGGHCKMCDGQGWLVVVVEWSLGKAVLVCCNGDSREGVVESWSFRVVE